MGKRKSRKKSKRSSKSISIGALQKSSRSTGLFSAIFTLIQAIIWIVLTAAGMIFFFLTPKSSALAVEFSNIYFGLSNKSSTAFIVKPLIFLVILVIYLFLSFIWFIASMQFIVALKNWHSKILTPKIYSTAKSWMIISVIICLIDVIVFALFVLEYVQISKKQGLSIFSRPDIDAGEDEVLSWQRGELITTLEEQRDRIRRLKDDIQRLHYTKDLYEASQKDVLASINPFLGRKKFVRVLWPTKKVTQNKTTTIESNKINEQQNSMVMVSKLSRTANAGTGGGITVRTPSLILLTVAFRGFIIWIINIVLLVIVYTSFKKLNIKSQKSIRGRLINFFNMLNCKKKKGSTAKKPKRKKKKRKSRK